MNFMNGVLGETQARITGIEKQLGRIETSPQKGLRRPETATCTLRKDDERVRMHPEGIHDEL